MKMNLKIIGIIFILINVINITFADKIDLSDNNPIVYCLKYIKKYNLEEIKDFILQNQDPEYAIEHYPNDESFSNCLAKFNK